MRPTTPVTTSLAHSMVATALSDVDQLQRWQAAPEDLGRLGVDPQSLNLEALCGFVGLSEKIRHNACRTELADTFRLLSVLGKDVEFFRDYAPTAAKRRRLGLTSKADRLDGLAGFVDAWAGDAAWRTMVRDLLLHEYTLATLAARTVAEPGDIAPRRADLHATPRLAGSVTARPLSYRPSELRTVLRRREPDLAKIQRGTYFFVYQRGHDCQLRVLEVEVGDAHLLDAIDGRTTAGELAARLLGADPPLAAFRRHLDELTSIGLLEWPAETSATCA